MLPAKQHTLEQLSFKRQAAMNLMRPEIQQSSGPQLKPQAVARYYQVTTSVVAANKDSGPTVRQIVGVAVIGGLPVAI
jgi:hypothetical protein